MLQRLSHKQQQQHDKSTQCDIQVDRSFFHVFRSPVRQLLILAKILSMYNVADSTHSQFWGAFNLIRHLAPHDFIHFKIP